MSLDELAKTSIDGLTDQDALDHIGLLIDGASNKRSPATVDRVFTLLDELRERNLAPAIGALTHYFAANAWESRKPKKTVESAWLWEQAETQAQILELRRAIRHDGFGELDIVRRCQILTNLANQLNHIGRFVDALRHFDRALLLRSDFAMAHGNRGIALMAYARALYDHGHASLLMTAAHDSLQAALAPHSLYDSPAQGAARAYFEDQLADIRAHVDIDKVKRSISLEQHSIGRSTKERAYRQWCLVHRLFINPINDLGALPLAARDVLTLPSMTIQSPSARVPPLIGFFNQMKQEFVSARYLCYEGINCDKPHFSDRDVLLYNTLDYPSHALAVEKIRTAFRIAYSLLDKIAFFLNSYLVLGHKQKQVSFKSVWYEQKGSDPRPLLQRFSSCQNWPLRGLFWLSKDIFEEDFLRVTEPDAEDLKNIREHLEHKYLQIHESWSGYGWATQTDELCLHLGREPFSDRALHLLRLVRAALIYLSLAVHAEERQRQMNRGDGLVIPVPLISWDDKWKQ